MKSKLLLPFVFLLLMISFSGIAQKCPRGLYDCPGLCGLFVDRDADGYCDLTEFSEGVRRAKLAKDSIAKAKEAAAREKAVADSLALLKASGEEKHNVTELMIPEESHHSEKPVSPATGNQPAEKQSVPVAETQGTDLSPANAQPGTTPAFFKETYDLISISLSLLIAYLFTFFLCRRGVIKKTTHRKIWNTLLLLTFLATGLLGLFLAFQLNYSLKFEWFRSLLYWHVEFGIAMTAISIFHMLWHWKYYFSLFKGAPRKPEK